MIQVSRAKTVSGHNKWSQIKRQKEVTDKKKGQAFSKFSKNISLAAKEGGDPATNFKLRLLIERAKAIGMPNDNIERAIKRGTGESKEGQISAVLYEGLGPAGSAFIVEAATDNSNRTLQEIRQIFAKNNGQLANTGAVAWMFDHLGLILAAIDRTDKPDATDKSYLSDIELAAIEAGALDVPPVRIRPAPLETSGAIPNDMEDIGAAGTVSLTGPTEVTTTTARPVRDSGQMPGSRSLARTISNGPEGQSDSNGVKKQGESLEITTAPKDLIKVKEAVALAGAKVETAELAYCPKQSIEPEAKAREQIEKLESALDENDDVVNVYHNLA